MTGRIFYNGGTSAAVVHAEQLLRQKGVSFSSVLDEHVTHLLLNVPQTQPVPEKLPAGITVIGGKLPDMKNPCIDLLADPIYLAENASITAHCAVKVALQKLPVTLKNCSVLIVGWGRIGKCLAILLAAMGARVTVAARKETDRAMALALGYDALDARCLGYELARFRVIFNTVPFMLIPKDTVGYCRPDCLKIELASSPGIEGEDVISARGLPGKEAPETSGELIAKTILRLTAP